jgi:hypothetical protein
MLLTGSIRGSKLSATRPNSTALGTAQRRQIERRAPTSHWLRAGRLQVQILSPALEALQSGGLFAFLSDPPADS